MNALLRIAWREFIGSLPRFRIYLACLGIGAFAIAASGSVTQSFREGVTEQAQMLLGGDVAFVAAQRQARPEELDYLSGLGRVAMTATLRTMAESPTARKQVDLRAIDGNFPLMGDIKIGGTSASLNDALAQSDNRWGLIVSATFLDELNLGIGDDVDLGTIPARITGRLDAEPDRLGEPGSFQPSAVISIVAVEEAGRLITGQLFRANYLIDLASPMDLDELETNFSEQLGDDSLRMRRPEDAVDGLQDLLDLLNSFLAVVGVASLAAGGVGIAQATSAFLESRTGSIAALKAFGASASDIRLIYLAQLSALAALGAIIGVALGAFAPYALALFAGNAIPLPQVLSFYPVPLALAFVLALLTAASFALPALGRARATPPSALFRKVETTRHIERAHVELIAAAIAVVLLVGIATLASPRPLMTVLLLIGAGVAYGLLTGAAHLIRMFARRAARKARGTTRLMLSNLGGPGSLAPLLAPALGLGLALLTLVASVQSNLLTQIGETAPQNMPSLVFSQVPNQQIEEFDQLLAAQGVDITDPEIYRRVPTLLARITSLKGQPLVEDSVAESERWVVGREIQATYLSEQPEELQLSAGTWWPADYTGPLLVSLEDAVARGLGLKVGDSMGFRIFGREIEAKVGSQRRVDWGGFGVNRAFIFSPGTLSAANPQHFAIAQVPVEAERPIIKALGETMPNVIVFQTREALATAAKIIGDISLAVNAIASVVTIAGLLVLAGALATIARKRRTESALLKTIGATRARLLGLYAGELAFAGLAATLIGTILGVLAAFPVVVWVFEAQWTAPWAAIATIASLAIGACALGGGLVGMALLSQRPAQVLRSQ